MKAPRRKEPTFCEDVTKYLKSIRCNPCRAWYAIFLASFVLASVFAIRLQKFLPGKFEPNSTEVSLCVRMASVVSYLLITISPIAFLYVYCEVPQKHFSMMIVAVLGMCCCFSISGVTNVITWSRAQPPDRVESFIEFEKIEFLANSKQSVNLKALEMSKNCCGVESFMDYPLKIFMDSRVPDHCCNNFTKGCGRSILLNSPLSYVRKRPPPADNGQLCVVNVESDLNLINLTSVINYETNASKEALGQLVDAFNLTADINQAFLCDDITDANYLDPICITLEGGQKRFFSHKFRWCFTVYFNDTPTEYGRLINNKFQYFIPNGCYKHLNDVANSLVNWSLLSCICVAILSFISIIVYFRLYEQYRRKQLTTYPLPLYLQIIPGETDEDLPVGLGRRCHVMHRFEMTTDTEVAEYLAKNPEILRKGLEKIEKHKRDLQLKIEHVPKSVLVTTVSHALQLDDDDKEPLYSTDTTETSDSVVDVFKRPGETGTKQADK